MFFSTYILPLVFRQPDSFPYNDNLIKAQTIGTLRSMMGNNRKAILITTEQDLGASSDVIAAFFKETKKYLENLPKRTSKSSK